MIKNWKNDGKEGNKNLKLFRISFNIEKSVWVKDPLGKYWGFHEPEAGGKIVQHKTVGELALEKKDIGPGISVTLGTPSLGIIEDEESV